MRIGILGAGQLGRMLALAGTPLGFEFSFLDPAAAPCAAALGRHIRADYLDERALAALGGEAALATFEFENVPLASVEALSARIPVLPDVAALGAAQDRLCEKQLFESLDIPVPRYAAVDHRSGAAGLDAAAALVGLPAVLKTRRMGYDGKGQFLLRTAADFDAAWAALGAQPLILESFVAFEREVSCVAVRGRDGAAAFYALAENQHRSGILRVSRPSPDDPLQALAEDYTRRVLERLDYVGVLAFEFFVAGERLLANEIAPRVHNSGHWTIEGAECSQFENHLRAIAGLPLGNTALRGPCAMLNFIGSAPELAALTAIAGVHPHLYGKAAKPLRKIGHATVTAPNRRMLDGRLRQLRDLMAQAEAVSS